ncbi:MAG: flagellar biosynthesis anti-sigma factor FlgM [Pirellula sp.]|jgi:flagellar biosynthesis anti-sigma factor FlgM
MQISGNFSVSGVDASRAATKSNAPAPAQAATQSAIATPVDQLELSAEALSVGQTEQSGQAFRAEKVASLREAIAQGTYDTDEKMSAALDSFLDQLG